MGLRELRLKRGWTQRELADRVPGVSNGRIGDWESGRLDVAKMSLGTALKLCDALRVSNPRKLLSDDAPGPDEG
ncbi:helix-turn-helix transcriptional regulator [Bifidobacterium moraviense]|uniref:helix-turn-helix transcriptional regulator n=1 Tax=Bifidobacterium moraviense TaxID=2675323 RepID=UPI00145E5DEB|nr:helix-turn-helix transcriptional regulator [Bifidobacterium sp. DSM 109958]